jgi:hypothetical protein
LAREGEFDQKFLDSAANINAAKIRVEVLSVMHSRARRDSVVQAGSKVRVKE